MVTGVNNQVMTAAINAMIKLQGGVVLVDDSGQVIATMPLLIAGLISDRPAEVVVKQQAVVDSAAHHQLGIPKEIDPVMTLSFLPLAVITKLKITTEGLFDVTTSKQVPLEVDQ